jgi:acyl-CoA thioesterase
MSSLRTLIENLVDDGGVCVVDAPAAWSQGRTLYGGMTAAFCARAASLAVGELPPLRSAQLAFIGPASGRLELKVATLRRGRASTYVSVDCANETGLAARALLAYGDGRSSEVAHDHVEAPDVPPPEACAPFFADGAGPAGFFQNFEMRLAGGARPFTGATPARMSVWVRFLHDAEVDPVVALLALADSLPPAAMTAFSRPAAISTMTWSIDLVHPIVAGDWRLVGSTSEQADAGYSLQSMSVWDAAGRRLAAGRQTVAIFI